MYPSRSSPTGRAGAACCTGVDSSDRDSAGCKCKENRVVLWSSQTHPILFIVCVHACMLVCGIDVSYTHTHIYTVYYACILHMYIIYLYIVCVCVCVCVRECVCACMCAMCTSKLKNSVLHNFFNNLHHILIEVLFCIT